MYKLLLICLLVLFNFAVASEWFRGNTHAHTVLCGHADSSPEVVAKWYHDHGYNFLILSEHNRFIDPLNVTLPKPTRDDFILIPGEEVSGKKIIHTTAMNIKRLVPWESNDSLKSDIIQYHVDETIKAGGQAILNHPNYQYAVSTEHIVPVKNLYLFELFNGHPFVNNHGDHEHQSTEQMWDQLLTKGMLIYGVSSDDAHHFQTIAPDKSNPGRGWVMVNAPKLNPDEITNAMLRGDFYSSNGIFLQAYQRGPLNYIIEVDEKKTAEMLTSEKLRGKKVKDGKTGYKIEFIGHKGKTLKEIYESTADYKIDTSNPYIRAKVTFTRKHKDGYEEYYAWGQPIFTDGREK